MVSTFKTHSFFKELQCHSQSLQDIVGVWRDLLKHDAALKDYCLAHYGRAPTIAVGCRSAAAADCPVIVLRPGIYRAGIRARAPGKPRSGCCNTYQVFIDWAVINSGETVSLSDGVAVKEQLGLTELDELRRIVWNALTWNTLSGIPGNSYCEFYGPVAQTALQCRGFRIAKVKYRIDGIWFPMLVGKTEIHVVNFSE